MPGESIDYSGNRFGLELRGSLMDPSRDPANAVDCSNLVLRRNGGMITRKGATIRHDQIGGFGLFKYVYVNTSGTLTEELLTVDKNLHRIDEGNITITYSGSNSNAYVKVYSDGTTRYLDLYDNGTRVLNKDLGVGFNETSTVTMAALKTAIDGVTSFTAAITGTTTVPAAFIENTIETPFNAGDTTATINFYYSTQISTPITNPFNAFTTTRNNANFENADFVNHKNCLYMTFPKASLKLYKYDSQSVYLAGLPRPSAAVGYTRSTSGSISSTVDWFYTYRFIDAVGNVLESRPSATSSSLTLSSEDVVLDLQTVRDNTGYNTNCAMADGAQTVTVSSGTVTLTVDNGVKGKHTILAGDVVYLFNRHSTVNDYKTYTVSSVTNTTIVVTSSDTIQVNDNDPISANLRIAIYRNQADGANYYLVAEIPNNSFVDQQSYTDSTADVTSNTLFVDADKTQGPPPTCSYVASFGNNLVVAEGNTLYYSDELGINPSSSTSSEMFPATDNQETIYSSSGGRITALANSGNTLTVFGEQFIKTLSGDLITDSHRISEVSNNIGCVSKSSIANIGSSVVFLDDSGVQVLTNGFLEPRTLSFDVDPYFTAPEPHSELQLKKNRAVGVNVVNQNLYVLFIPREETSVNNYSNSSSEALVYDYDLKRWMKWKGLDLTGGAVFHNDYLWFSDRSLIRDRKLWRTNDSDWGHDYYDHEAGIDCFYRSGFESFGTDNYKKARWIKPYTILTGDFDHLASFTLTCKTYIDYMDWWMHTSVDASRGNVDRQWGFPWGKRFGGPKEVAPKLKLRSGKVRSLQTHLEGTASGAPIILTGWKIYYSFLFTSQPKE